MNAKICISIPEYVGKTILAIRDNRVVGCEGGQREGYSFCKTCPIGKKCYMKIFWIFGGGDL